MYIGVSLSERFVRITINEAPGSKCYQKWKINKWLGRSVYGEVKNTQRTSLASLETEKKPLYGFCKFFTYFLFVYLILLGSDGFFWDQIKSNFF